MQDARLMPGKENVGEIARTILVIVLLALVMGFWAYLWVPPPIF